MKMNVTATAALAFANAKIASVVFSRQDDDPQFGDRVVPRELRGWLARLRLLQGVPFSYLVADAELLPKESIRFFYLDRAWTDALVQGALSVGTVNSSDRAAARRALPGRSRRARRGGAPRTPARRRDACSKARRGRSPASCSARAPSPAGRACTCAPTTASSASPTTRRSPNRIRAGSSCCAWSGSRRRCCSCCSTASRRSSTSRSRARGSSSASA